MVRNRLACMAHFHPLPATRSIFSHLPELSPPPSAPPLSFLPEGSSAEDNPPEEGRLREEPTEGSETDGAPSSADAGCAAASVELISASSVVADGGLVSLVLEAALEVFLMLLEADLLSSLALSNWRDCRIPRPNRVCSISLNISANKVT